MGKEKFMKAIHKIVCSGCGKLLAEIKGEKGVIERRIVSYGFGVDSDSVKRPGEIALAICDKCGAKTPFDKKAFL